MTKMGLPSKKTNKETDRLSKRDINRITKNKTRTKIRYNIKILSLDILI
jgi:hypothetical protein